MKKIVNLIIISLIISLLGFIKCDKLTNPEMLLVDKINLDTLSFEHSLKGWELYSWPNGNDWNYSILVGTNIVKSYDEVTGNKIIVTGKDSLKMVLDKFPENENILWIGKEWLKRCWGGNYGNPGIQSRDFCYF